MKFFRQVGFLITAILAGLSIFKLLFVWREDGISPALELVISYYSAVVHATLFWLPPAIHFYYSISPWPDSHLGSTWPHVGMILGLSFAAYAATLLEPLQRAPRHIRRVGSVVLPTALLLAFIPSVALLSSDRGVYAFLGLGQMNLVSGLLFLAVLPVVFIALIWSMNAMSDESETHISVQTFIHRVGAAYAAAAFFLASNSGLQAVGL